MLLRFERYCDQVCSQVRCTPDHPLITAELTAHMEDRRDAYLRAGFPEEEAEQKAVEAMGDPMQVGKLMAKAHPMKWDILHAAARMLLCLSLLFLLLPAFNRILNWIPSRSYSGQPVLTVEVNQSASLGDGITFHLDRMNIYVDGFLYYIQLDYRFTPASLNVTVPEDAFTFRDNAGTVEKFHNPSFLLDISRAATVYYVDYNKYGRTFHMEIPIDWGDVP